VLPTTPPLTVTVAPSQEVAQPGSTVTVSISLSSEGVPKEGEVALWLVDKALLELVPSPLPNITSVLYPQSYSHVVVRDNRDAIFSRKVYQKMVEIARRR
jgi:uncharacterized protein YfaS (alpha-2-macroglobulin family)